jgi:hypothetical protein
MEVFIRLRNVNIVGDHLISHTQQGANAQDTVFRIYKIQTSR